MGAQAKTAKRRGLKIVIDAHLAAHPLKEASERIASRIASAMRPADTGPIEVVELRRSKMARVARAS